MRSSEQSRQWEVEIYSKKGDKGKIHEQNFKRRPRKKRFNLFLIFYFARIIWIVVVIKITTIHKLIGFIALFFWSEKLNIFKHLIINTFIWMTTHSLILSKIFIAHISCKEYCIRNWEWKRWEQNKEYFCPNRVYILMIEKQNKRVLYDF